MDSGSSCLELAPRRSVCASSAGGLAGIVGDRLGADLEHQRHGRRCATALFSGSRSAEQTASSVPGPSSWPAACRRQRHAVAVLGSSRRSSCLRPAAARASARRRAAAPGQPSPATPGRSVRRRQLTRHSHDCASLHQLVGVVLDHGIGEQLFADPLYLLARPSTRWSPARSTSIYLPCRTSLTPVKPRLASACWIALPCGSRHAVLQRDLDARLHGRSPANMANRQ